VKPSPIEILSGHSEDEKGAFDEALRTFGGNPNKLNFPNETKGGYLSKRPRPRQSKYRGVCWCRKGSLWKAAVQPRNGKKQQFYFGEDEEELAARKYDEIAKQILGKKAILNFPNN
jgi:hypothetical protein